MLAEPLRDACVAKEVATRCGGQLVVASVATGFKAEDALEHAVVCGCRVWMYMIRWRWWTLSAYACTLCRWGRDRLHIVLILCDYWLHSR